MATKWQVNKAVKTSGLPPSSRLIVLTLSDSADAATGVIPAEHTPSLRDLAEWTGLDKATVTRHLTGLEAAGWVVRNRPTTEAARHEHARTTYRINIPHGAPCTMPNGANETGMVHGAPSHNGHVGDGMVQAAPTLSHGAPGHGAQDDRTQVHGAPVPYIPDHYQTKEPSSSPKAPKESPTRPDVEQVCTHLADRIEANGSKRPTITTTWRTEARLLIDKDGRTPDQVMLCIDWCQADPFWKANILSMPKLRAKYDQLRLAAAARASPNSRGPKPSTTDERVNAALNLAEQLRQEARKEITG